MHFQPIIPKNSKKIASFLKQKYLTFLQQFIRSFLVKIAYQQHKNNAFPFYDLWNQISPYSYIFIGSYYCYVLKKIINMHSVRLHLIVNTYRTITLDIDIQWDLRECLRQVCHLMKAINNRKFAYVSHKYCGKLDLLKL